MWRRDRVRAPTHHTSGDRVTEIDETPSGRYLVQEAARELNALIAKNDLPPGSLLANYVGVAQVLLPSGGTRVVRVYPFCPLSGSLERGMLGDALSDSNYERDSRRRSN